MSGSYNTIITEGNGEFVDRKSRFLGRAVHVENEAEAMSVLESIRKKHYDARHNCWAYVLGESKKEERASDDGEPSGTAGRPILEVIRRADLTFTLIAVTRYFGGTLLGTGGLVRAYTAAAEEAAANALFGRYILSDRVLVVSEYADAGKLQYLFSQTDVKIASSDYKEKVYLTLLCSTDRTEGLIRQIIEQTSGRASVTSEPAGYQCV